MSDPSELSHDGGREAIPHARSEETSTMNHEPERSGPGSYMERIVSRPNLVAALKRVKRNKGSPGIDGMTVEELSKYLQVHWPRIREELLAGRYRPSAIRQCEIPKSGGGMRKLGIPTALDRFIQQAILQVLQPEIDPTFSEHSHGFRPRRSAHDAIREAHDYVERGRDWVVDVDLEQFFDRVNHDVLMSRVERRIPDRRLCRLIRRYLRAGILANGVTKERDEGTPQGGPLSPLLANLLLDEIDKELERRGHAFVRYADDCNVYVASRRAGERLLERLRTLYGKLHLRVNEKKSKVARTEDVSFLGYVVRRVKGKVRKGVADSSIAKLKDRVRELTPRTAGRSLETICGELRAYLLGWKNYFRLAESKWLLRRVDGWMMRRLRAVQLKQWRRGPTVYRALRARGVAVDIASRVATNAHRWWRTAGSGLNIALPTSFFEGLGVPRLHL